MYVQPGNSSSTWIMFSKRNKIIHSVIPFLKSLQTSKKYTTLLKGTYLSGSNTEKKKRQEDSHKRQNSVYPLGELRVSGD